MWEAWPWPTTKRSFTLEKRAQKEAERIQKIQAEIAAFEQKVAATTPEEKELLTLRLDVATARLNLVEKAAEKEAAFAARRAVLRGD